MAKRTASGTGSIRQRSNGGWEARYTAPDGTRKSIYGKTQKEVKSKLTAILHSIDTGAYQEPSRLTVGEWLWTWLDTYARPTVKPSTLEQYRRCIRVHLVPHLGSIKLQRLRGADIQRMYNELLDAGTAGSTIHNIAAPLKRALSTAQRQRLILQNPCDLADLPKAPKKEVKPFTTEETAAFLEAIKGDPLENAFAVCLFCGLREGEVLGLAWDAVDFEAKTLTVSQQLQKDRTAGTHIITTPKSKPRVIVPPPIAFEYLRNERVKQAEARLLVGPEWNNPDNLVFTGPLGKFVSIPNFFQHFKRIAASIGRPDAHPHTLRHTAATMALASGADVKSVQNLLGHSSAAMTLDIYSHATEQMQRDTAERMQNYFDSIQKQG